MSDLVARRRSLLPAFESSGEVGRRIVRFGDASAVLSKRLSGHADPRTTGLYDRRKRKITRNILERISA